jgi:hypothetical protein
MLSILVGLLVAVLTFGGGYAGLRLQSLLPDEHSVDKSREMIGSVMGLVTLLLALVLGTIVGSAYFFSATQVAELQTLSARGLQLDRALAEYGPETKAARDAMKTGLEKAYQLYWGGGEVDPSALTPEAALANLQGMHDYLGKLDPKTPEQIRAAAAANANFGQLESTRILMSLQLANAFSKPLLICVVFWSVFLFCGFGLLSRANATTLSALAFGAFAVASAVFLILELSQPYTGLFRISPAALTETIQALDK